MIARFERWLDRKKVVDNGTLAAAFGYGVVFGIVIMLISIYTVMP
jgi:hypothetical protein